VSGPRAVFLDRDGVLNRARIENGQPYPPRSAAETVLVDHAAPSLERLKRAGFLLFVVTNQPDVRRGTTSIAAVEEIHAFLAAALPVDHFFACYHDDADRCSCRKPAPGMLFQAQALYGLDLAASYLIGDRWRDIDAGAAAGCRTVLIDYRYAEREPSSCPDAVVASLAEAVDWVMQQEKATEPY
jgi:D-glycero-D-manno-heptose 1,7-bisphosphate phosphatase